MTAAYNSTTTLNLIRRASPCESGWKKLLAHLNKKAADDEPLPLLTVLASNGLDDALWVLSSTAMPDDRLARHFQAWCAEQVLHLFEANRPGDRRVRDQIATLRKDEASDKERDAAMRAAADAAADAREYHDAWDAATTTIRSAAYAAFIATDVAARGAADADAAARAATRDAAWHTVWDATRKAQETQLRKMITEEAAS